MKATQIFPNGQVRAIITYDDDNFGGIVPEDPDLIIEGEPNTDIDYWTGSTWITPPDKPSAYHFFDYSSKLWIDSRGFEQIKSDAWVKLKRDRDTLEFGGFSFNGYVFDSDQISQSRIFGAMLSGLDHVWTTKDNQVVELTIAQIQAMCQTLQQHVANAHALGRTARSALDSAQTLEEIKAITL